MSQYVYRNADDTKRIAIHKVEHEDSSRKDEWNVDLWTKHEDGSSTVSTYSEEAGDLFATRRQAKRDYERVLGPLESICPKDTVTEGWKNQEQKKLQNNFQKGVELT